MSDETRDAIYALLSEMGIWDYAACHVADGAVYVAIGDYPWFALRSTQDVYIWQDEMLETVGYALVDKVNADKGLRNV